MGFVSKYGAPKTHWSVLMFHHLPHEDDHFGVDNPYSKTAMEHLVDFPSSIGSISPFYGGFKYHKTAISFDATGGIAGVCGQPLPVDARLYVAESGLRL